MMNQMNRDRDELEGALLLPEAHVVSISCRDSNTNNDVPTAFATVASAIPISRFNRDIDKEEITVSEKSCIAHNETSYIAHHSYDNIERGVSLVPQNVCNNDERHRNLIRHAERKGRAAADQELEHIARTNYNVNTINHFVSKTIEEANQIAQYKNQVEQFGLPVSSATAKVSTPPSSIKEESESYHTPYRVGEYVISEYDTSEYKMSSDYSIPEYKSVYDH